ncbi:hypothetical protein BJH93_12665 [Kocuria polaris]|nr:hypothetical protein [Kocuria polaris]
MTRCSLLMIIEDHDLPAAVEHCADLADDYRRSFAPGPIVARQELYAFGAAGRIQEKMRPPRRRNSGDAADTVLGPVHAIWVSGHWLSPDSCPPAPAEDNGATAWQWTHYDAVTGASPAAWLVLWDLKLAAELAA